MGNQCPIFFGKACTVAWRMLVSLNARRFYWLFWDMHYYTQTARYVNSAFDFVVKILTLPPSRFSPFRTFIYSLSPLQLLRPIYWHILQLWITFLANYCNPNRNFKFFQKALNRRPRWKIRWKWWSISSNSR